MKKREIKFRAWSENLKQMFNPMEHDVYSFDEILSMHDKFKVMQYTGLKDKIGKEIYEGDILQESDEDGVFYSHVYFEDGAFIENGIYPADMHGTFFATDNTDYKGNVIYGKITGNIFENPELLELLKF